MLAVECYGDPATTQVDLLQSAEFDVRHRKLRMVDLLFATQMSDREVVQYLQSCGTGGRQQSSQYRGVSKHAKGKWEAKCMGRCWLLPQFQHSAACSPYCPDVEQPVKCSRTKQSVTLLGVMWTVDCQKHV